MIEQICECQKCGLYLNQKPLLDTEKNCHVFWVGLSAKKVKVNNVYSKSCAGGNIDFDTEVPLSPDTNTGMLLQKIEQKCKNVVFYKTNLVKCLPLTNQNRLRYPNKTEIDLCFENLITEINAMSPKIVFLLGEKVSASVQRHLKIKPKKWDGFKYYFTEHNGVYYIPIQHPSYIYVYKRKEMQEYIDEVYGMIKQLLCYSVI